MHDRSPSPRAAPTALASPCYVFSDAHIGVGSMDVEVRVLQFLDSLASTDVGSIVVNGDLVDFWFEWRHVVPRAGYRVVAGLSALARAGVPVVWIAGNHDCWGADVVREAGIQFVDGTWRGVIAGWNTYAAHGDGLRGVEDRGYRALRKVLRHAWAIRAFRFLHPDWGVALARGSAHASRTYRAPDEGVGLRDVAFRLLSSDHSLDLVIFGHSHVPELVAGPQHGVYANAGEWLEEPTYLRIEPDRIELLRWSAAGSVSVRELARRAKVRT